ncbi:hypothetical protein AKJ40_04635 [candidate division MSBL1 archaeon SCGC-AAA259M10]|uniref:Transcription regulator AsnC/Lrp ligand binding domain-containing protein n=5 Tax=candidate division MSBL1 TaxID=215777 RepID=A0A133UU65_9EURY|nr:hypothetical protein AKJ62_02420 [candidate division MSBL1 archaeon SCGC-AAA259D14]KXA93929.1 hypothetical protein AKJ66_00510 [candidate division MSBL1 archaeon SCGC-AAA259E22]KXA95315.1 hypothetical protein AKJ36_01030 [candidate division MSBL1 archaeon SCGC-AAA259I07]KXA97758.1 hypothetical protein AKJ38_00345 [candidate division MSBL1 archaeon SCGC-AAA259I14]KXA98595.1 hypothetical protein AKJ40_04635 [candidate division MSBL1 archaeon SCGC-AAA259M10]
MLVNTKTDVTENVYNNVKKLKEVQRVAMLTGPYDIMAIVKTDDIKKITNALMNDIRKMNGVERTTTCVVIS